MLNRLFGFLSLLTLVAIGSFLYFGLQVSLESSSAGSVTAQAQVVEAAPAPLSTEAVAGEKVFKANCASCHKVNRAMTGPALAGINEKYAGDEAWLYEWIRNAPKLINEKDPKAVALYDEWAPNMMSAFPTLTDEEIDNLLAYVQETK
jgi:mono/diheme cytochrome c family protein